MVEYLVWKYNKRGSEKEIVITTLPAPNLPKDLYENQDKYTILGETKNFQEASNLMFTKLEKISK